MSAAGDWTGLGGAIAEPIGRLRFAGEHCPPLAPGCIGGGCETGHNAADAVRIELGLKTAGLDGRSLRQRRTA